MSRRRRARNIPIIESDSDSEFEESPNKKLKSPKENLPKVAEDSSSSESDIENYLQPINKLDFSSEFFNPPKKDQQDQFDRIEKNILEGVSTLSSSDSDEEKEEHESPKINLQDVASTSKQSFQQLNDFTRKLEEAKVQVEKYQAKTKNKLIEQKLDISNLLAAESENKLSLENITEEDLHSSDFEDTDDEWEEVKVKEEKPLVPQENIEIRLGGMPDHVKKKKGVDLLAAMKRRLNRIRKSNQVLVHKVHLLCWIAHGNFLNFVLNDPELLAPALSLLPSENSYPSDRPDLGYLEKIVQWYKKHLKLAEKPKYPFLGQLKRLQLQIDEKVAYDKKDFVLIFIAILRSLGLQCRLVLSFQVEPLHPPSSELHKVSTKEEDKKNLNVSKGKISVQTKGKNTSKTGNSSRDIKNTSLKINLSRLKDVDNVKKSSTSANSKEVVEKSVKKEDSKREKRAKPTGKQVEENLKKDKDSTVKVAKNSKKTSTKVESKESKLKEGSSRRSTTKSDTKKAEEEPKAVKSRPQRMVKNSNQNSRKDKEEPEAAQPPQRRSSRRNLTKPVKDTKTEPKKSARTKLVPQLDGANDEKTPKKGKINLTNLRKQPTRKACTSKNHDKSNPVDSEDEFSSISPKKSTISPRFDVKNDIVQLIKGRIAEQKAADNRKLAINKRKREPSESSDSDYMPEPVKKKRHDSDSDIDNFLPKTKVKKRIKVKKVGDKLKVLSDDEAKPKKKGMDVWLEVFLEAEEKWITVDLIKGQVHCVNELFSRASHPMSYVVAWNNDNTLKDVTMRYCKNFNTVTRKLRVESKWWDETIKGFKEGDTPRSREEDRDLSRQQMDQPLPTSISEYKNHPLYALTRHLLKFEAMYPEDVAPLGYVRKEPVYPRNSVYVCKSRDIWLKDARVVKPGEKPYKIVKGRPKYDKMSNQMVTGQLLELYGIWQTTDYEPPEAKDGVVPRNAYGNVELFKLCMLPKGTVYLQLPGLNKVCRKLNIDCASAITGFDFHGGWSHPVYGGFVVCKEYEETCINAWQQEQEEIERKENEKLEKRVYTNWKKLIRGLLLRERMKAKYDFGGETKGNKKSSKK